MEGLQNDEWLVSTWSTPDIAVSAFSNRDEQVVAYTLTSLGPDFTPFVEYVRVPPNGRYSYEETYLGGGATQGKSVVLADCLPFSVFETAQGCPHERVEALRAGLHVTSMTVGDASAHEALAQDGALFFPEPGS